MSMHLLILGGSPHHPGGIEAFCDRSKEALETFSDWRVSRISTGTAYFSLRQIPLLLKGLGQLISYRSNRPNCVWLQYGNLFDLVYLPLAKLLGYRVMVTPHLGSNWRSQSNLILRTLSGWALQLADRLALISMTQEQEIKLPRKTPRSLIRNFLPEVIFSVDLTYAPPPSLQLIHSGRLSEGKGTFLVIEICAKLRDIGIAFHARITGSADSETSKHMHKLIAEYGLESHVSVLGRVPEDALLEHLKTSDLLVHLSRIDSYPLIVLEAAALSALPVCMELAGARNMVELYDGQIVSQSHAVEEVLAFIKDNDLQDIRRRGKAAASKVRADYSWKRCARALQLAVDACTSGNTTVFTEPEPV